MSRFLFSNPRAFARACSSYLQRNQAVAVPLSAILCSLIIFRRYLFAGTLLYGDANFMWTRGMLHTELWQFFNIWRSESGGVSGAIANASQSWILLQAVFSPFGIPLSTVLVPVAIIATAFISFWRFARVLGAFGFAAIIAAAFYSLNPWLWDQLLAGHLAICAATALAPVVIATLVRFYRGAAGAEWLLLLLCALELLADPRISLFVYAIVFGSGIIFSIKLRKSGNSRWLRFAAFTFAAPILGFVANGWWTGIYVFVRSSALVPPFYPPVEDVLTYSAYSTFSHALVLSGYFIHFEWQQMLQFGAFSFAAWYGATTLFLVAPLLMTKPNLVRNGIFVMFVIAFIMSMGAHALPLPVLYWMYAHIPLLSLLREPVKFDFIVAFSSATLTAIWLRDSSSRAKIVMGAAIGVIAIPVFVGALTVPDGHGLQIFSQRPQFLRILKYLRQHGAGQQYRIAVLPPWLAEQSLGPGQFYTANPFVIQSEVPVIDAKIVNTASATDNAAWQAYYELYWGTARHPARTLANFGIRYVIVEKNAVLSPGAAATSFYGVSSREIDFILKTHHGFLPVYHVGGYWIYKDRFFRGFVRAADTPAVIGPVAPATRAALPPGVLGDDFERLDTKAVPHGIGAVAPNMLSACVATASYGGLTNAYASVTKHDNYLGYWVASDWMIRGPNDFDSRILARFSVPYAFTRSTRAISVRVSTDTRGVLYAQLGTLGTEADLSIDVDGKSVGPILVTNNGFSWYKLAEVGAGSHVVTVRGSPTGALFANVAVATSPCDGLKEKHPYVQYYVPSPVSSVAIRAPHPKRSAPSGASPKRQPHYIYLSWPKNAVAFDVDGVPHSPNKPFIALKGIHKVTFYAPVRGHLNGPVSLYSGAPYGINKGTSSDGDTFELHGGKWPQIAEMQVSDVLPDQFTLLRLKCRGGIPGAQLVVRTADLSTNAIYNLQTCKSEHMLIPYFNSTYTVEIVTPVGARGHIKIESATVNGAASINGSAYFVIPSKARRVPTRSNRVVRKSLAHLHLSKNGSFRYANSTGNNHPLRLQKYSHLILNVNGLTASKPTNAILTAFYTTRFGAVKKRALADIAVDARQSDRSVLVPVLPNSVRIDFSLISEGGLAQLSIRNATLESSLGRNGGAYVSVPSSTARYGRTLRFNAPNPEQYKLTSPTKGPLIGDFTYNPNWHLHGGQHWEADDYKNAWIIPNANNSPIIFNLQELYRGLQIAALIYFLFTGVMWITAILNTKNLPGPGTP